MAFTLSRALACYFLGFPSSPCSDRWFFLFCCLAELMMMKDPRTTEKPHFVPANYWAGDKKPASMAVQLPLFQLYFLTPLARCLPQLRHQHIPRHRFRV